MVKIFDKAGWVMATIVIILSVSNAYATATTHIWAPSTDVQAFKKEHLTSDYYFPSERDASGARIPTVTNLGLTVGVLPWEKMQAEIGFDHKSGLGDLDDYPMYFNFKLGIPENAGSKLFPALAIGIFDAGTEKDKTNNNVGYVKAAKTFEAGEFSLGRYSVGYFQGNKKLLLDKYGEKDNSGVFAAWERTMNEISDKLWICVEYMGTKSTYGCWNYGFSWKCAGNTSFLLGYDVFNNKDLANTVTMQIDIDL